MHVAEQTTSRHRERESERTRAGRERKSFKWIKSFIHTSMHFTLKHRSWKEKRLSASRVGRIELRRERINTCPRRSRRPGRWRSKRCEVADGRCSNLQIALQPAQFTPMISGLVSIPTLDRWIDWSYRSLFAKRSTLPKDSSSSSSSSLSLRDVLQIVRPWNAPLSIRRKWRVDIHTYIRIPLHPRPDLLLTKVTTHSFDWIRCIFDMGELRERLMIDS